MTIDQDLDVLERSIRQLQIEWEKFFQGIEKRPPTDLKVRVERMTRKYDMGEIRNNASRFRYQNLIARYSTFNELWQKRLRALEEGRPLGFHGARAQAPPPRPEPVPADASDPVQEISDDGSPLADLLGTPHAPAPRPVPPPRAATGRAADGGMRVADPSRDKEAVQALYKQFLEERKRTGESANVKFDSFEKLISQQASRILSEKGATAVDFRLETKDGKVSLKARPVK